MFRLEALRLRPTRQRAARGFVVALLLLTGACSALLVGRPGGTASLSSALAADAGHPRLTACAPVERAHPKPDSHRERHDHGTPSARPAGATEGGKADADEKEADEAGGATDADEDDQPAAAPVCASQSPPSGSRAPSLPETVPVATAAPAPLPSSLSAPVASQLGPLPVTHPGSGPTPLLPLSVHGTGSAPPPQSLPVTVIGGIAVQTGSVVPTPVAPTAAPTATPPPGTAAPSPAPPSQSVVVPLPPVQPLPPITINVPRLEMEPSALTLWLAFSTIAAVAIVFGARLLFRSR